jgi:CBS domain-containing protein
MQGILTQMATAADIMTTAVVTTTAGASVWTVARQLLEHGHGGMPVVGQDGALVGMVSGFDVISKDGATIGEIMSRGVVWANPGDSLADVIQLMGLHGIRRVPVCENGSLIGIISRSDLLRYFTTEHESSTS